MMNWKRTTITGISVLAAILVGAWFALRSQDGGTSGFTLDVPQSASASDQGLTFLVSSAGFSATGTYLLVNLQADDVGVARVDLLGDAFSPDSLRLRGPAILRPSQGQLVRFEPILTGSTAVVSFGSVWITTEDGGRALVTGDWQLTIDVPTDLGARLRLESLSGGARRGSRGQGDRGGGDAVRI
jgi:hypothetical protein